MKHVRRKRKPPLKSKAREEDLSSQAKIVWKPQEGSQTKLLRLK